jgi:hypothetical protein
MNQTPNLPVPPFPKPPTKMAVFTWPPLTHILPGTLPSTLPSTVQGGRARQASAQGSNFVAKVITGFKAQQQAQQAQHGFDLKHIPNTGRSPPRGGVDPSAENQQFVLGGAESEEEEAAAEAAASAARRVEMGRLRRLAAKEAARQERHRRKAAEKEKVRCGCRCGCLRPPSL